jgi:hypothetical protein
MSRGKYPTTEVEIDPMNLAWVAGIIEGEGSFMVKHRGNSPTAEVSISMTDEDVLLRVQRVTGLGRLYGPYVRGRSKPTWYWRISRINDCILFGELMWPLMGQRRKAQIETMWKACGYDPGTEIKDLFQD